MKTNKSILTPEGMYSFAGKALRPCFILAIIVILAAMYVGFFLAPVDATQGNSYRILYIHVACAWMAMLLYVVMAIFCSLGLITENRLWPMVAASLAPTGCLMAFLALWTGSLWGRPTWGAYWVWDARLTSALILFFFYLGYIALQNAIPDWRRADKACCGDRHCRRDQRTHRLLLGSVVEHASSGGFHYSFGFVYSSGDALGSGSDGHRFLALHLCSDLRPSAFCDFGARTQSGMGTATCA